jgi:hypothetical protein
MKRLRFKVGVPCTLSSYEAPYMQSMNRRVSKLTRRAYNRNMGDDMLIADVGENWRGVIYARVRTMWADGSTSSPRA